jgi:hypothetical protein
MDDRRGPTSRPTTERRHRFGEAENIVEVGSFADDELGARLEVREHEDEGQPVSPSDARADEGVQEVIARPVGLRLILVNSSAAPGAFTGRWPIGVR